MGKYGYRIWVPLANFESTADSISIGDDFIIRQPSEFEEGILASLARSCGNIGKGTHLLEVEFQTTEPEAELRQFIDPAREKIERAISLFRLFKEGLIGFNVMIQPLAEGKTYRYRALSLYYVLWRDPKSPAARTKYELRNDEVESFKKFINEHDLPSLDELKLAVAYFNKSYIEPHTTRDGLLDLMIALENLYLKGISEELRFRLSTRIACLLGNSYEDKKRLHDFVKKAYILRSRIVHGEIHEEMLYEDFLKIRKLVRDSLTIFLKDPRIRDELDDLILKGNSVFRTST